MINKEIIEEIKARADILNVISDYVNLKKAGSNFRGLSPFNNERTPSFFVVPSKGFFKDFSSGKAGDAITFLMEMEGISYMEAIQQLGKKYGIEIDEDEPTEEELLAKNERDSLFIVMKFAAQYYQDNLWKHEEGQAIGLPYFRERGFNEATIKAFDLGYSLDVWDGLIKEALDKSYNTDLLEKAGLIIRKDHAKVYDRFRGRVMFPIHSLTGRVIAFGARILSKNSTPGFEQPKYINSPETEIYHKSDVLYGVYQAKQAIRQEDNCYLVEGYTDVISMYQAGIQNVVASSGTSLTHEQIKLISRYTKNITVLFDGDAAGIKASLRGIDMILEGGLNVKAVVLPEGEDPDSYARRLGGPDFVRYIKENQQDFIRFKIALYQGEAHRDAGQKDPIKKAGIIREIIASISKIPDPIQRQVYVKESGELLDIDESILITELNKIYLQQQRSVQKKAFFGEEGPAEVDIPDQELETEEEKSRGRLFYREREITRLLIQYGQLKIAEEARLYQYMMKELEGIEIQTELFNEIIKLYLAKAEEGSIVDEAYLVENSQPEIGKEIIDLVFVHYVLSENWEVKHNIYVPIEQNILDHVVYKSILELKHAFLDKKIHETRQELLIPDNEEEKLKRLHFYMSLRKEVAGELGIVVS